MFLLWQIHFSKEVAESGIPPVYWCTAHYVEMLLKAEVPLVHSAFKMSGFTPSQVLSVTLATLTNFKIPSLIQHICKSACFQFLDCNFY